MATLYSLPLILYLYSFIMCECLICDWDELLGRELTHRVALRAPWRGDYTTLDGQDIGFLIVEVLAELFVEGIRDRCEYFLEVRFLLHNEDVDYYL